MLLCSGLRGAIATVAVALLTVSCLAAQEPSGTSLENEKLQTELLSLSTRSKQPIADRSFPSVEIDQPEVVVDAIRQVVDMERH